MILAWRNRAFHVKIRKRVVIFNYRERDSKNPLNNISNTISPNISIVPINEERSEKEGKLISWIRIIHCHDVKFTLSKPFFVATFWKHHRLFTPHAQFFKKRKQLIFSQRVNYLQNNGISLVYEPFCHSDIFGLKSQHR